MIEISSIIQYFSRSILTMSREVHLYTLQGSDSSSPGTCHSPYSCISPSLHTHTHSSSWPILKEEGINEARTNHLQPRVCSETFYSALTNHTCTNLTPTRKSDQKSWPCKSTRALESKCKAGWGREAPVGKDQQHWRSRGTLGKSRSN